MGHPSRRSLPEIWTEWAEAFPCKSLDEARATLMALSLDVDSDVRKFYAAALMVRRHIEPFTPVRLIHGCDVQSTSAELLEELAIHGASHDSG